MKLGEGKYEKIFKKVCKVLENNIQNQKKFTNNEIEKIVCKICFFQHE